MTKNCIVAENLVRLVFMLFVKRAFFLSVAGVLLVMIRPGSAAARPTECERAVGCQSHLQQLFIM